MSLTTNVVRRAGSARYYLRVEVPADLAEAFGAKPGKRKELWKSLGTTDQHEAKRRARQLHDEIEHQFSEVRKGRPVAEVRGAPALDEGDIQAAIWKRYVALIEADERFRADLPTDDDLDELWRLMEAEFGDHDIGAYRVLESIRDHFEQHQRERIARHAQLKADAGRGETRLVASAAAAAIKAAGKSAEKGSADYRRLAQGLVRAEVEALNRAAERDEGDYSGAPKDRLVTPPTVAPASERIAALFEQYAMENPAGVRADTLNQSRAAIKLFLDAVGHNLPVGQIDKKAVRTWKALLMKYPVKATETAVFKGLSIAKIVEKNETIGKPTITAKTVNRYLSSLGAFCDWLAAHDYISSSPLVGMYLSIDKDKRTTLPFAVEEMNTLFASPLFTGCKSDDKWHVPGSHRIRDHRFWLPLVMLYSGARPGEIAQLLVDDVRELHGVPIIHITTEGEGGKSTKTKGSQRVVPIHRELIRLGFLDFCKRQKAAGETRLFPEAERNARGQIAATFSREFGRYLGRIGIKEGRGLSLYSFRHGVADAFRRAGYPDEQFAPLFGHTAATTTGRYGLLPEGTLKQRAEMIEAINYPGLDLSILGA